MNGERQKRREKNKGKKREIRGKKYEKFIAMLKKRGKDMKNVLELTKKINEGK